MKTGISMWTALKLRLMGTEFRNHLLGVVTGDGTGEKLPEVSVDEGLEGVLKNAVEPICTAYPDVVIESLAEYVHDVWSRIKLSTFEKGSEHSTGGVLIPREVVSRWRRQIDSSYYLLSEDEKESDREEARKILTIIHELNK